MCVQVRPESGATPIGRVVRVSMVGGGWPDAPPALSAIDLLTSRGVTITPHGFKYRCAAAAAAATTLLVRCVRCTSKYMYMCMVCLRVHVQVLMCGGAKRCSPAERCLRLSHHVLSLGHQ
jgi:hypothetical protein